MSLIGIGPQWAMTIVNQMATVVSEVRGARGSDPTTGLMHMSPAILNTVR